MLTVSQRFFFFGHCLRWKAWGIKGKKRNWFSTHVIRWCSTSWRLEKKIWPFRSGLMSFLNISEFFVAPYPRGSGAYVKGACDPGSLLQFCKKHISDVVHTFFFSKWNYDVCVSEYRTITFSVSQDTRFAWAECYQPGIIEDPSRRANIVGFVRAHELSRVMHLYIIIDRSIRPLRFTTYYPWPGKYGPWIFVSTRNRLWRKRERASRSAEGLGTL